MAARQQSHENLLDHRFLPHDPLPHFRAEPRSRLEQILARQTVWFCRHRLQSH
jgi:hypothetical protein